MYLLSQLYNFPLHKMYICLLPPKSAYVNKQINLYINSNVINLTLINQF